MSETKDHAESFVVELKEVAHDGEIPPDEAISERLTLKAPGFVFVEKPFLVTGTTEGANQEAYLMRKVEAWNVDWFARDEKLAAFTSDAEGKFELEVQFDRICIYEIYVAQKREWLGIDWLAGDIKSPYKMIIALNYLVVGALVLVSWFLMQKKGIFKKGIFKKGIRRKR